MSIISSYAAPVSVTTSTSQELLGIYMRSYFESANAATTGTPTVNTATAIPATSGYYLISKGTTAYLWTPQFSSSTLIAAGRMNLGLWVSSTPSIDGSASAAFNAGSGSVSLTTTQTNDVIYVAVAIKSTATATISGGGLTWYSRGSRAVGTTGQIYTFYAIASSTLSAASITATLSTNRRFVLTAFAISGANTVSPFDSSLTTPASASGTSTTPSVTFTTSQTNDFIISTAFVNNNPTITLGTDYTLIANTAQSTQMRGVTEYKTGSDSGSQTSGYSLSNSNAWAIIGDAVVPASQAVSAVVSVSSTNSAGTTASTLVSSTNSGTITSSNNQVASVFDVASGTIPASGYIKVAITAPAASNFKVRWGAGVPTNFQIAFTYG